MKTTIYTPHALSLYYYSDSREATIDEATHTLTTHNDDGDRTHTYHPVSRFETFQILKYGFPLLSIFLFEYFELNLKSELSLLTLALVPLLWHRYLRAVPRHKIYIGMIIAVVLLTVIGTMTTTLSLLLKIIFSAITAVALYESAIGLVSQEYRQMGKVYIEGVPRFFVYYFFIPRANQKELELRAARKIESRLCLASSILSLIAMIMITITSYGMYQDYRSHNAAIQRFQQYEKVLKDKEESDTNHRTQIVHTITTVKLDPETKHIRDVLKIEPETKEVITRTYPWEPGYQQAGEFVVKDGVVISRVHHQNGKTK